MATSTIKIPDSDYISEHQFAVLVGKSLRTVRRWSVERKGPRRTRLGKTVFYSREAITSFLKSREEAA